MRGHGRGVAEDAAGRKRIALCRFVSLGLADLALADAYQLPPATIQYLHQLVGRAHNQLYRQDSLPRRGWYHELFVNVPQRLYADGCLRLAFAIFWGVFLLCADCLARSRFAPRIVGKEDLLIVEQHYSYPVDEPPADEQAGKAGFFLGHNATIGLRCFAFGLLAGIGGLYETVFNASRLGAMFGYMVHSPSATNFFHFVTAHGPFELTAVVLMAAAGMRLGFSMIDTGGHSRADAVYPRRAAERASDLGGCGPLSAGGRDRGLCVAIYRRVLRGKGGHRRLVDRYALVLFHCPRIPGPQR